MFWTHNANPDITETVWGHRWFLVLGIYPSVDPNDFVVGVFSWVCYISRQHSPVQVI